MPSSPRIGARIRRARQRLDMSQEELAAAVGASRSAVNAWERDRALPRNIVKLEEVLGVSLEPAPAPGSLDDLMPPQDEWEARTLEHPDLPDEIKRRFIEDYRRDRSEAQARRQPPRNGAAATAAG